MKVVNSFVFGLLLAVSMAATGMAQGFGEYGRALGGVAQRQGGVTPQQPGAVTQKGKGASAGVGDIGGAKLPSRLIVIGNNAVLFPRQDDQAEKIASLSPGEILVPVLEGIGGSAWYMVKTSTGVVGWVKSADVRHQP